ncbi:helix-turn-helix domain-containing protein [Myxococcota bacterium]|nr:helix-turn-helix domain-containing protein [Myxococcota bacterium]MBU1382893.1 helix-turn-helix domain-containing protein [Myxococcota bacterium]MBU1496699.1 helix-turn-helix domain-containing protein [Myxococcota bacterium]
MNPKQQRPASNNHSPSDGTPVRQDRYLTEREACEILGVSRSTLVRWRSLQQIGFCRLPSGAIRYRLSDLENCMRRY